MSNGADVASHTYELLKRMNAKLDNITLEMGDLKQRVAAVEEGVSSMSVRIAQVEVSLTGMNKRLDRADQRFDRIERRLDLHDGAES